MSARRHWADWSDSAGVRLLWIGHRRPAKDVGLSDVSLKTSRNDERLLGNVVTPSAIRRGAIENRSPGCRHHTFTPAKPQDGSASPGAARAALPVKQPKVSFCGTPQGRRL